MIFKDNNMKKCSTCKIKKELTEFNKRKASKDGLRSQCKSCEKAYYEANKDKIKVREKDYRESNKDKKKVYFKAYREANKDKINDYQKEWYEANREKRKTQAKAWYEANKDKKRARERDYKRERRKTDSLFKMKNNLRSRTWIAFKNKGYSKTSKTQEMLGVDWEVCKAHIERQFTKGMNWDNQGEWHIDHKIPLASANTEKELKKLCHYSNLQPLWAEDNISKSDKINGQQVKFRI